MPQVTSGKKYWSDNTPVAGQQFDYSFDDIGNRKTTTWDTRQATYTPNNLNQYTQRTVPGYVNVLGMATNTATVSLWSKEMNALYAPTTRKGDYFRGEIPVNNATGAVWLTITNVAALSNYTGADIVASTTGKLFVPKTPELFGYDPDGNLTNDGRWSYTWDAENRVTSFTRNSAAPTGSRVRLDCQYDSKSRRTQKVVSTWNTSTLNYQPSTTNRFIYDGWNLIAILDATNGLVQSFSWGTDASGSMQGAGGVGGLISMTVHTGTNAGTYFYCFDGNHNVAVLVNATNGAIAAQYDYASFGELLRATGPLAFVNPFTFSTKFCDWETGFLYYGYRYYDPDTGRWLSRDPIEELGGNNLYGFLGNESLNRVDTFGLVDSGWLKGILGRLSVILSAGQVEQVYAWLIARLVDAQYVQSTRTEEVECPKGSSKHLVYEQDKSVEEIQGVSLTWVPASIDILTFNIWKPKSHFVLKKYACCKNCWGFDAKGWQTVKNTDVLSVSDTEDLELAVIKASVYIATHTTETIKSRECKETVTPVRTWEEFDFPDVLR